MDRGGRRNLYLSARRVSRTAADADRGTRTRRSRRTFPAYQHAPAPRRGRLYLRRRVRDDRVDRRQARPAAPPSALRRAGRRVRPPDLGAECRDAFLGARCRRERRGLVHVARPARTQGFTVIFRVGPREEAGRGAGARRRHGARTDRGILRRHGRRPHVQGLSAGRCLGRHPARRDGRRAFGLWHAGEIRLLRRLARGCHPVPGGRYEGRGAQPDALLRGRELWPVYALPRRNREGGQADGNRAMGRGVVERAVRRDARRLDLRPRTGRGEPADVSVQGFPRRSDEADGEVVMRNFAVVPAKTGTPNSERWLWIPAPPSPCPGAHPPAGARGSAGRECKPRGGAPRTKPITFTLDGVEVEARAGETIWQAAKRHGTDIP